MPNKPTDPKRSVICVRITNCTLNEFNDNQRQQSDGCEENQFCRFKVCFCKSDYEFNSEGRCAVELEKPIAYSFIAYVTLMVTIVVLMGLVGILLLKRNKTVELSKEDAEMVGFLPKDQKQQDQNGTIPKDQKQQDQNGTIPKNQKQQDQNGTI